MKKIETPPFHSEPFPLRPGVQIGDIQATECVVRLLTRGDEKVVAKEPEDNQATIALARRIVRLGTVDDPSLILLAVQDALTKTDEFRILSAYAALEARALGSDEPEPVRLRRTAYSTDVIGEPFELKPGFIWDGKPIKTAVVRLIRRGEFRLIEKETDETRRDDLTIYFSLHQLGESEPTFEMIDLLTSPDMKRILDQEEALRARNAPADKSI